MNKIRMTCKCDSELQFYTGGGIKGTFGIIINVVKGSFC